MNETDWVAVLHLIEADFQIDKLIQRTLTKKVTRSLENAFPDPHLILPSLAEEKYFYHVFCNNRLVVTPGTETSLSALVIQTITAETREPPVCILE